MVKLLKSVLLLLMVFVFSFGYVFPASAEVTLEQLLHRIEKLEEFNVKLEQENAFLKNEVRIIKGQPASQDTKIAAATAAPAGPTPAPTGNFLETKFKTKMYGYVKADAVFNDSVTGTLNMYPVSETTIKHNDNYAMAANETRLGFDIETPAMEDGGVVSGKIEGDFWASTNTASVFRLRQAYMKLAYSNWDVLAGQTWDFFSPLGPNTLNFGYGWNSGNIGDRHVQMIVSNKISDNFFGGKLSTKVGALESNLANQDTSSFPVSGALIQYDGKILNLPTTLYVAGVIGRLESKSGTRYRESLYAGTSGMTVKLTDRISVKAEGYTGSGLVAFRSAGFNGVNTNGIDTLTNKAVDSRGGFAEVTIKPTKKLESNTGFGVDVVDSRLISSDAAWTRNNMYYTNLKYSLTKDFLVGVEYQYFTAQFSNATEGNNNRVQTSMMYKF